jgi:hypothetical protein
MVAGAKGEGEGKGEGESEGRAGKEESKSSGNTWSFFHCRRSQALL